MQYYYSDDTNSELIEIHSEHVLWKWKNESVTSEDIRLYFEELLACFEKDLGCPITQTGRSGRHICIEKSEYRKYNKAIKLWKTKYRPLVLEFIV